MRNADLRNDPNPIESRTKLAEQVMNILQGQPWRHS
jgi:hypothetical protein